MTEGPLLQKSAKDVRTGFRPEIGRNFGDAGREIQTFLAKTSATGDVSSQSGTVVQLNPLAVLSRAI